MGFTKIRVYTNEKPRCIRKLPKTAINNEKLSCFVVFIAILLCVEHQCGLFGSGFGSVFRYENPKKIAARTA
jgi:hypothetical protein